MSNGKYRPSSAINREYISRSIIAFVSCAASLVALNTDHLSAQGLPQSRDTDWRNVKGTLSSTAYAALDVFDVTNVNRLRVLWQRPLLNDVILQADARLRIPSDLHSTPIMVNGVLYASLGTGTIVAIDATTGTTLWMIVTDAATELPANSGTSRGVAYWTDGLSERLFYTAGTSLVGVDPKSGQLATEFGQNGLVTIDSLSDTSDFSPTQEPELTWLPPPLAVGGNIVVATGLEIRSYNARSGEETWQFQAIPQASDFGTETWENDSWRTAAMRLIPSPMSADEELGLLYVTLANTRGDWYGGQRAGDNLFSNSLVSLDLATGARRWHYQFVHHGLWNYEEPTPPILSDIVLDGRNISAVVQATEHGFIYVLNRETGEPVWPIEERQVPASDVPGELLSPTQPMPTWPPPFERQVITDDALIGFTPVLRAEAIEIAREYRRGALYSPPLFVDDNLSTLQGTLALRASIRWGSIAMDPQTGALYVASTPLSIAAGVTASTGQDARDFEVRENVVNGPGGLPLVAPPYGRITAIDLNDARGTLWEATNGDGPLDHPVLRPLAVSPLGHLGPSSVLVTESLVFVGEGPVPTGQFGNLSHNYGFRAFDRSTGEPLTDLRLPGAVTGTLIGYMIDGRPYVVMMFGGAGTVGILALTSDVPNVDPEWEYRTVALRSESEVRNWLDETAEEWRIERLSHRTYGQSTALIRPRRQDELRESYPLVRIDRSYNDSARDRSSELGERPGAAHIGDHLISATSYLMIFRGDEP